MAVAQTVRRRRRRLARANRPQHAASKPGRPAPAIGPGTALTTMLSMFVDVPPAPMFAAITNVSMTSAETPLNTLLKTCGGETVSLTLKTAMQQPGECVDSISAGGRKIKCTKGERNPGRLRYGNRVGGGATVAARRRCSGPGCRTAAPGRTDQRWWSH